MVSDAPEVLDRHDPYLEALIGKQAQKVVPVSRIGQLFKALGRRQAYPGLWIAQALEQGACDKRIRFLDQCGNCRQPIFRGAGALKKTLSCLQGSCDGGRLTGPTDTI
jgi:hypothetical protein